MNIALIKDGKVENIIVADLEFAEELGYDEVLDTEGLTIGIGWTNIDNVWTAPTKEEPLQQEVHDVELTYLEFLLSGRFTDEEIVALYSKEKEDSTAGLLVHITLDGLRQAKGIILNHPNTQRSVAIWVQAEIITPERAVQILQ